jgi:hypothetical protein
MGNKSQHKDMKRKAKNQANIMTRKKHSKKIMIKKTKNHDMEFFKKWGCICDINHTRVKKMKTML